MPAAGGGVGRGQSVTLLLAAFLLGGNGHGLCLDFRSGGQRRFGRQAGGLGGHEPPVELGRFGRQGLDVTEHEAGRLDLLEGRTGLRPRRITGPVERRDAEEIEHELAPLLGPAAGEGVELLLLAEHRRAERFGAHAEHVMHVLPHSHGPGRHPLPVADRFGLDAVGRAREGARHLVEVPVVLELHGGQRLAGGTVASAAPPCRCAPRRRAPTGSTPRASTCPHRWARRFRRHRAVPQGQAQGRPGSSAATNG